jgi:tRNA dimethylallyltransferase
LSRRIDWGMTGAFDVTFTSVAMTDRVLIITGPTASGKSRLAVDAAAAFDGVVINADSMQVYRELPVLTAQPGADDMARASHRLYGVLSVDERFSVAAWRQMALAEIEAAVNDGRLPILCGGSGLYLKAVTEGLADIPAIPEAVRRAARDLHDRLGGAAFHARLAERDPATAARLAPGDRQRLCRAWEVVEATGRPLADWLAAAAPADGLALGTILLAPPRAGLYAACDTRFDAMLAAGALAEVAALDQRSPAPELPAFKALGVADLRRHLAGEVELEAAVAAAKRATRNYAKRQMTWFRHQLAADLVLDEQYSESLRPKIFSFIREFLLTGKP